MSTSTRTRARTPVGIVLGLICAGFASGSLWVLVDGVRTGAWLQSVTALLSLFFFAIGAVGGLLGADRLPEKSIADLVGWPVAERALNRPVREWFTPR